MKKIKGYLNFDMIGRNNDENRPLHVVYFYTAGQPVFGEWLKKDIQEYRLQLEPDYRAWDRPTGGSDNATFALHDIPIMWYHTDGHRDYHLPGDESDKLNWNKLVEITRAAFWVCGKWPTKTGNHTYMALSAHQRIKSECPIQLHKPAEEGHTTSVRRLSDPRREVIRPRYAGRTLYKPPQESPFLCVREFISSVPGLHT